MGENGGRPATGGFEGEGSKRIEDGRLRGLAASALQNTARASGLCRVADASYWTANEGARASLG